MESKSHLQCPSVRGPSSSRGGVLYAGGTQGREGIPVRVHEGPIYVRKSKKKVRPRCVAEVVRARRNPGGGGSGGRNSKPLQNARSNDSLSPEKAVRRGGWKENLLEMGGGGGKGPTLSGRNVSENVMASR